MAPETVSDLGELRLIERIVARLGDPAREEVWAGDDTAVLHPPSGPLLYTTDALVERVDFDFAYCSGFDAGWKAVASNLSDVAAMGGRPLYAVASLLVPPSAPVLMIDELAAGMAAAAQRWEVALVGGDVGEAREVSITVALIGTAERPPVLRSGARPGNALCVTGSLGGAGAGVHLMRSGAGSDDDSMLAALDRLAARQLRPEARVAEGRALAEHGATAMIDVSDGLAVDLGHLMDASGTGCAVDVDALPLDDDLHTARALTNGALDPVRVAVLGGEDFELLCTLEDGRVEAAQAALEELGTPLTRIGSVTGSGRHIGGRDLEQWKESGWEHLRGR